VLRVTADANILVSGINFRRGNPFEVLELARVGKINTTVSVAILDELSNVLQRKFHFTPEDALEARTRITAMPAR
jgi:predicted nucleic acid-binding protein